MRLTILVVAAILCTGGSAMAQEDEDIQVMVCPATPDNTRNSEASIVVLKDGTLLLAYSRFCGGTADHAAAISQDEGKTWGHFRDLETESPGVSQYAYASMAFHEDRVLLTYWVIDDNGINLKFRSLPVSWFYETEG